MIARAFVIIVLLAATAAAQDSPFIANSGARPMVRPDGTYVFNHQPNPNEDTKTVFEAQIAPRIIIMDSIGKATEHVLEGKAVWGWQASASPMVRLRMFQQISNPVRTPSYMPKGNFQIVRFKSLGTSGSSDDNAKAPVSMWLVDIIPFGHHSNGQDGCLFTNQTRIGDDCVEQPGQLKAVNKENGSFSTNYFEASAFYGRLYLGGRSSAEEFVTNFEWRGGVTLQLNPKGFVGGSIDDELAPLYGQTRVGVEGMMARRNLGPFGRVEGLLRLQYIHDAPSGLPPIIASLQATFLPRKWGGTGVFARFYSGQDYYNLGFADDISRVEFGIALQQPTFLSFKLPSTN
jgi:hypothetical protein